MELFNPNQMAADFAPLLDLGTGPMPSPVKAYYEKLAKRATQRKENFDTALAANSGIGPSAFNQMVADEMRMARDNQMLADSGMIQGSIGSQAMQPGAVERASSPVTQMMSGQLPVGPAIPEGGNSQGAAGPINFADVQKGLAEYERIVAERPKAPKLEQARLSDGAATLAILVGLFGGDRRAAVDVLSGALQGSQQLADANNKQNVFDFEQELAEWEAKLKPAELTAEINRRLFETQLQQQGMNERADMNFDRALKVADINANTRLQGEQIRQDAQTTRTQMQLDARDLQFARSQASREEQQLFNMLPKATPGMRVRIIRSLRANPVFAGMSDEELDAVALEPTVAENNQALAGEKFNFDKEKWRMDFDAKEKRFNLTFSEKQKESAFKRQQSLDNLEIARQRVMVAKTAAEQRAAKDEWSRARKQFDGTVKATADDKAYEAANRKIGELRARQNAIKGTDADSKKRRQDLEADIAEAAAVRDMYAQTSSKALRDALESTDAFLRMLDAREGVNVGELPPFDPGIGNQTGNQGSNLKGNIGGNQPRPNNPKPKPKPKPKPQAKPLKTKKGTNYEILD